MPRAARALDAFVPLTLGGPVGVDVLESFLAGEVEVDLGLELKVEAFGDGNAAAAEDGNTMGDE